MTGLQIKSQTEAFTGEIMDNTEALTGINEGISKMGPIVEDEVAATDYISSIWYNLPNNCIKVTEVNPSACLRTVYTGYRTSSNGQQILFADSGSYVIRYNREPNPLAVITDTPEMHVAYHKCLVTYLKGWFKYKEAIDNDEKQEGLKFMETDFYGEVAQVRKSLRSNRNVQMIAQRHA
jgi:hypothetical protein